MNKGITTKKTTIYRDTAVFFGKKMHTLSIRNQ